MTYRAEDGRSWEDYFYERLLGRETKLAIDRDVEERSITAILEKAKDSFTEKLMKTTVSASSFTAGIRQELGITVSQMDMNDAQSYHVQSLHKRVYLFLDRTLPNHIGLYQVVHVGHSAVLEVFDCAIVRSRGFGKKAMIATRALHKRCAEDWFIFPNGRPVPTRLAGRADEYIKNWFWAWEMVP